jgi:hypothetical protein
MSRVQGTLEAETRYTTVETEGMFGVPEFNLCCSFVLLLPVVRAAGCWRFEVGAR